MSTLRLGDITDEMIQAMDTAKRQGLQKDLRALAANIRADAEGRYDEAEPTGRSRVDAAVDREHRRPADRRHAVGSRCQNPPAFGLRAVGQSDPVRIRAPSPLARRMSLICSGGEA
ncbi:hypothetical protein [Streptomyces sp. NPDC059278]|uniref:hypothetical protein n=1 Tax=Streptomyces sp. NPDC059278 TaxID=3346801 RepID=UPI0036AFD610